jgi:choline dehydrogenase-like flavoprotein
MSLLGSGIQLSILTESLPDLDNRVVIGPGGKTQIHLTPNNEKPHVALLSKTREMMAAAGLTSIFDTYATRTSRVIPMLSHIVGTIRMGSDPATSVLDSSCRAHDVENLYVVDGSFFPSQSSVNCALTIVANALRVASHLKQSLNPSGPS